MAPKYYVRIIVGLVLLVIVHVAYYQYQDHMNQPPTVPDNVRIVDGDRLVLDGTSIHLYGIDAPELGQSCRRGRAAHPCGLEAKAQLEQLFINSGSVVCKKRDEAKDGWQPATCTVNGRDVNGEMVRLGYALVFRDEAFYYTDLETEAKQAARGIWASEFEPPWEWRASR